MARVKVNYAFARPAAAKRSPNLLEKQRAAAKARLPAKKQTQAKPVASKARKTTTAAKTAPKVAPKVTKKVIAKKPALTPEEKARLKEEREQLRAARLAIKEEKARIKAEKDRIKQEKLRMWELVPSNKVPEIKTNPLMVKTSATRQNPTGSCCLFCNNRECLQAAVYKDTKAIKSLLADTANISNPFQKLSVNSDLNMLKATVIGHDFESFKLIVDFLTRQTNSGEKSRVKLPQIALTKKGTGQQNRYQHNFPMRQVNLSRGGKEGDNAFTHDNKLRRRMQIDFRDVLKLSPGMNFVKHMLSNGEDRKSTGGTSGPLGRKMAQNFIPNKRQLAQYWAKAVRKGNFQLVKYIFEENKKQQILWLSRLHQAAILQGKPATEVKMLNRNALLKQSNDEHQIMPAHIACINPDPSILQNYFRMYPTALQLDAKGRDLIHYAVVNENFEILQFLISKRQMVNNADSDGMTPLMLACKYGKKKAVNLLIDDQLKQLFQLDKKDDDYEHYAKFYSYVDAVGPYKNTPLHFAMRSGQLPIIKALVQAGAQVDCKNFYSDTPLSVACTLGHLEIAQYLIKQGANIHGVDKQQRTPLIRACQNGQVHVVSALLREGVNVNFCDLSGNTALHYACAYGWLNVVKLLVEGASADINRPNEWKSSPTIIAMLKGHFGIVDYLLSRKEIDASLVDDQGRSLVAQLCIHLNEDSFKNLKFLISKNKIDVAHKTVDGYSPLHILACNDVHAIAKEAVKHEDDIERKPQYFMRRGKRIKVNQSMNRWRNFQYDCLETFVEKEDERAEYTKMVKQLKEAQIQCAKLLIKQGCKVDELTGGKTPSTALYFACESNSYELAEFLLSKATSIAGSNDEGVNILHHCATDYLFHADGSTKVLKLMAQKFQGQLKKLGQEEDSDGAKPFHLYFTELVEKFNQNNFIINGLNRHNQVVQDYTMGCLTSAFQGLEQIVTLFARNLEVDVSARIGIPKYLKEEAQQLVDQGAIKKALYDKLLRLELDDYDAEADTDADSNGEKVEYGVSGIVIDPKKKNLGTFIKLEEEEDENDNQNSFGRFRSARRKMAVKRRSRMRRFGGNSDSEEEENEDEKNESFSPKKYYEEGDTLKNSIMLLIQVIKKVQNRKDCMSDETFERIMTMIETQVISLLGSQPQPKNGKQSSRQLHGFNKPNRKGNSILAKALKHKMINLSRSMIASGTLDLSAQQRSTGLAPMHLIANYINDMSTVVEIFKIIDKRHVNVLDKAGNSPLHNAALKRNLPMCQMLCEVAGLSVNAKNRYGCTPLHMSLYAFNEKKDHSPALERYLLAQGANAIAQDSDKRTPLVYLFFKGREPADGQSADPAGVLQAFLDNAGLTKPQLGMADRTGNTILHYACMAGATISAMNLISAGCDTRKLNCVGNSPFSMALAHGQQQICTFMLPNGFGEVKPVNILQESNRTDTLNQVKGLILPKELHEQWFVNDRDAGETDEQLIARDYTQSQQTPFYLAMVHGWDGIGFLLLSLKQDRFEALVGCLQAQKFGKFVDLLQSVPREVVTRSDSKGRNLVLILMRHLGTEITTESQEYAKVMEIVSLLISAPQKKTQGGAAALLASQQSGYGLSMSSKDARGYNMFHTLAKHSTIQLFEAFLKSQDGPSVWKLLAETCRVKSMAAPLVSLALEVLSGEDERDKIKYVDLLSLVKAKIGAKAFQDLPWTYVEDEATNAAQDLKLPRFLDFQQDLISDGIQKGNQQKHIISKLLETELGLSENQEKLSELFKLCEPFFNYKDQSGETLLIKLIRNNGLRNSFEYLLGSSYDEERKDFVFGAKSRPRINLDAQDKQGRTALHYVLQPSQSFAGKGFKQETCTIRTLLSKGASMTIKDKKGVSPLDLVKDCKALLEIFSPKAQRPATLVKQTKSSLDETTVEKSYSADADAYLVEQMDRIRAAQMVVDSTKPQCEVDNHEDLKNCEVVQSDMVGADSVTKLYFDTVMIKIDIKAQYYGVNNFYVIQLLRDKAKDLYILWTRWGRIGDFGQYQRTPFPSLLAAQMEFAKVFRQKSGNKWEDVLAFEALPKKYKLRRLSGKNIYLTPDMRQWETCELDVDMSKVLTNFAEHTNLRKSNLSQAEFSFIKPLVDSAYILRRLKKQKFSENLVFEGLLDRRVIQRLHKLLIEMLEQFKDSNDAKHERSFEDYSAAKSKLFDLANQYYELTTPTEFAFDKMMSMEHEQAIISQFKKVQRLRNLEQASQLLMAAAQNIKTVNPYDYCFNKLSCNLKQVNPATDSYQLLMRYINAGLASNNDDEPKARKFNLGNIFEVGHQPKSKPALFSNVHQHMMLFHGTSKANLLSILEQGMQIKPSNAAFHNGSAFGEGIYLSDDFMFASKYSEQCSEQTFYVLVCEVALGNVMNSLCGNTYSANESGYFIDGSGDFARGYHSVRIMGRRGPDFDQNWIQTAGSGSTDDEVIWPVGDFVDYDSPVWKAKPTDEDGCQSLKEVVQSKKPKKAKKKVVKRKKRAASDSDDESMEDSDDDGDVGDKETDEAEKMTLPKQVNAVMSSFEPHVVNHFEGTLKYNWGYQNFNYQIPQSQYVVANSDQVRVKYIVQVEKVKKSKD